MCELCNPEENDELFEDEHGWFIEISTGHWNEYYDDFDTVKFPITYCPHCGRLLYKTRENWRWN